MLLVQGESSCEWMGLVHVLEGGEEADGMPGVGFPVVAESGGEDASNRISAAGVAAADGTSDAIREGARRCMGYSDRMD